MPASGRLPKRLDMRAWIQKHDLSAQEFEAPDSSAAKSALHGFDWQIELNLQARTPAGSETCDPGLGFVSGCGSVFKFDVSARVSNA